MDPVQPPPSDQDTHSALLFALVAESLSLYYEHNSWLTHAQGATLAANWLSRSAIRISVSRRKHLSELSDQLARQIADSVSREAGLHISYEMNEALDERYISEIGESIREECRRLLADVPFPE